MDLIYTNAAHEDLGVLLDYDFDLAFGENENSFECTIAAENHCCEAGSMIYIEGTEYGGIVDAIESNTASEEVTYSGRTWHGVIQSKIVLPLLTGETSGSGVTLKTTDSIGNSLVDRYLIISGDANRCIAFILNRCGLSALFEAPAASAGVNINRYQFNRYTDAYTGLVKMLSAVGMKPVLTFTTGKVVVSAVYKNDHSNEEFDSDIIDVDIKKTQKTVNHLVCLGQGELENRLVVHLYANASGVISQTQTQFGLNEYAAVYDNPNCESENELIEEGTERLQNLWNQNKISVDIDNNDDDVYGVGDVIGANDEVTGISVTATITKKIVKISNGEITIDIKTDSVSASRSGATGDGGEEETVIIPQKNLLMNPFFTVNQRGKSSYSGIGYTVDRWYSFFIKSTVTVNSNSITFKNTNQTGSEYVGLFQYLETPLKQNAMYTFTADFDGTAEFWVWDNDWNAVYIEHSSDAIRHGATFTVTGSNWNRIAFYIPVNSSITIRKVKLEFGSVSTLANDSAPDYVTELLKCQRFYVRFPYYTTSGFLTSSATNYYMPINVAIPMRTTPSANFDSCIARKASGGYSAHYTSAGVVPTSLSVQNNGRQNFTLRDSLSTTAGDTNNSEFSFLLTNLTLTADL